MLVTASELGLQELIHLQSLNKANWMEQNFNLVCQTSFENVGTSKIFYRINV